MKKPVERTSCYASLSSSMPAFQIETCRFSSHSAPSLNDIAHSHSPIQQPSLWLSNHRLHLFFFSSLLSLSLTLFALSFCKPIGSSLLPHPVCPRLSKTNPVVSKKRRYWRKCLLTFRHRLVLCRGAACYLWLRLMWLAEERYNYVWHRARLVLEVQ